MPSLKRLLLISIFLMSPFLVLAQSSYAPIQLSINQISLSTDKIFSLKETVEGNFNIQNVSKVDENLNLNYTISLISGNTPEERTAVYDTESLKNITIKKGDNLIHFTYSLPSNVPKGKDLKLQVQLFKQDGTPLNWVTIPIKISSESLSSSWVEVTSAYLEIQKEFYFLDTGPTITKEKEGTLNINLKSLAGESPNNLGGEIVIYDFKVGGNVVSTTSIPVDFKNGSSSIVWKLPLLKPGVYAGTVNIFDKDLKKQSQEIPFRYIVGGDIAKVRDVKFNNQNALTVLISGTPDDISEITKSFIENISPTHVIKGVKINVIITDDTGKQLGQGSTISDISKTQNTIKVPLEFTVDSVSFATTTLKTTVTLKKDDQIIDSWTGDVEYFFDNLNKNDSGIFPIFMYVYVIFGLLLIGLVYLLIVKKTKNKKIRMFLFFAGILILSLNYFNLDKVRAQLTTSDIGKVTDSFYYGGTWLKFSDLTKDSNGWYNVTNYIHKAPNIHFRSDVSDGSFDPAITAFVFQKESGVNFSLDSVHGYIVAPGEKFNVAVESSAYYCLNMLNQWFSEIWNGNSQKSKGSYRSVGAPGYEWFGVWNDTRKIYGNFVATTTPGFYSVNYTDLSAQHYNGGGFNSPYMVGTVRDWQETSSPVGSSCPSGYSVDNTKHCIIYSRDYWRNTSLVSGLTQIKFDYVVPCADGSFPDSLGQCLPAPVSGECGEAAIVYVNSATNFSGSFCKNNGTSTPESIIFPAPGQSKTWSCSGLNNGPSGSCVAVVCSSSQVLLNGLCTSDLNDVSITDKNVIGSLPLSVRLIPSLVNKDEHCTVNSPEVDLLNSSLGCRVVKNDINQVDKDIIKPGFQIETGSGYKVICINPNTNEIVAKSSELNCAVNPSVKEI